MNSVNDELTQSEYKDYRRSYIFVRKTIEQMKEVFESRCNIPVIKGDNNEELLILKSIKCLERIRFGDIREYQIRDTEDVLNFDDSESNNSVNSRKKEFLPGD